MVQVAFKLNDEEITLNFQEEYTLEESEYIEPIIKEICIFLIENQLVTLEQLNGNADYELFRDIVKIFKEIINRINSYRVANSPAKVDLFTEMQDYFIKNIKDALNHLIDYKSAVCKIAFKNALIDSSDCFLKKITTTGSDSHCRGKTVLIFELQSKGTIGKIVHKPFSVLIDFLLLCNMTAIQIYNFDKIICINYGVTMLQNSLAGMINHFIPADKQSGPRISTYAILPIRNVKQTGGGESIEEYGFIEYIDHVDTIENLNIELLHHEKLWEEAGMIAAFAWLVGMNDAHHENVLLSEVLSLHFYLINLIDSENSFLPNVSFIKSCLYSQGYGGFSFFEILENISFENEQAFRHGVKTVFNFINDKSYLAWLTQPLLKKANIRVVPIKTHDFTMKRKAIITKRLEGENIEEIMQGKFLAIPYAQQNEHNALLPTLPPHNGGYPLVIYLGENILGYVTSLYHGDIPTYHMKMTDIYLINDENQELRHPNTLEPFNYFLLSPLQAAHNKLMALKNNRDFKRFVEKMIYYNFEGLFSAHKKKLSEMTLSYLDRCMEVMFYFLDSQRLYKKYGKTNSKELDHVFFNAMCRRLFTNLLTFILDNPNEIDRRAPVLQIVLNLFSFGGIVNFKDNLDYYLNSKDVDSEKSQRKISEVLLLIKNLAEFFKIDICDTSKNKWHILSDLTEKNCHYLSKYNAVYFDYARKEREQLISLEKIANSSFPLSTSSPSIFFGHPSSVAELETVASRVEMFGLHQICLPKDDHCLYRAVSLYLINTNVTDLREIVAETIGNNLEYFGEFLQLPKNVSMENFIENIRSGKEWAGEVEIQILMDILQRPIVVLDNNADIRNHDGIIPYLDKTPIFVFYDNINHYDALLLNEDEQNGRELLSQLLQPKNKLGCVPKH